MVDSTITKKLARAFPGSFINTSLEFIAHKDANQYFILEDCMNEFDVKCKVLEWLSRGAFKTCPYSNDRKNSKFHKFMLDGINEFLEADFSEDDIAIIYQRLGNCVRHELTQVFVGSWYDMNILKEE